MRVEQINGRYLLCGGILPNESITVGQVWAPAAGAKSTVTIVEKDDDWVTYEGTTQSKNTKDVFSFQCRYCLVLPTNEIPGNLK
jgi:hypothetical protein